MIVGLFYRAQLFKTQHIESQFKEGMSWNNYGKWHIDSHNTNKIQTRWYNSNIRRSSKTSTLY